MSELKQKTIKGVMWSAVERFSVQGIGFGNVFCEKHLL
jgi:hypothetical protein